VQESYPFLLLRCAACGPEDLGHPILIFFSSSLDPCPCSEAAPQRVDTVFLQIAEPRPNFTSERLRLLGALFIPNYVIISGISYSV